jgi:hypothetical protein
VQDVTYDGDPASGQLVEAAYTAGEGIEVEESLGRVLAAAITGVDDCSVGVPGSQARGTHRRMPDHYRIRPQSVEGHDGVEKSLALLYRAALLGDRDHIRSCPAGGELERNDRASRCLEEGQTNGPAGERMFGTPGGVFSSEV